MKKKVILPVLAFIVTMALHVGYSVWQSLQLSNKWLMISQVSPLSLYITRQNYFLGYSYALAAGFTVYALLRFLDNQRASGIVGILGGFTISGVLYTAGCFLIGCCGSPMLAVYVSLFGSTFLNFAKPLSAGLTLASIVFTIMWMRRKEKANATCTSPSCACTPHEVSTEGVSDQLPAEEHGGINLIRTELSEASTLAKCQKCGCMKDALDTLGPACSSLSDQNSHVLSAELVSWSQRMQPIKYSCLGCEHCFPAVAMNIFSDLHPEVTVAQPMDCSVQVTQEKWPVVVGEYFAMCGGTSCPVAISTLASAELAKRLADLRPKELCIVGKTETENIGIDKIIKNTITNPTIHFLLLAGKEPKGHESGKTLLALSANGVDEKMRIKGSPAKRPILRNVTLQEVEMFRRQVQLIDMIGCEDESLIAARMKELAVDAPSGTSCHCEEPKGSVPSSTDKNAVQAQEPTTIVLDKAGYFVIVPQPARKVIVVEHYAYDNRLLRTIEGGDARILYWTIIQNNWVSLLSHAAYIGKELTKAELSIKHGFPYIQDGA